MLDNLNERERNPNTMWAVMGGLMLPTPTSRDGKGRNQRDDATCLFGAVTNGDPTTRPCDDGQESSDVSQGRLF